MASQDIASKRMPYRSENDIFDEEHLQYKDPLKQFKVWFDDALNHPQVQEANKMVVATATKDGRPSCRWLLLKEYDDKGFTFYTNYNSRKGQELFENPFVALTFYWEPLNRQIRVEGSVHKISVEQSDAYFHSRPRPSQIGAIVSQQSSVIRCREDLHNKHQELSAFYGDDKSIPRPDYWGGFFVNPSSVEFWQGQTTRMHDRILFRRVKDGEVINPTLTKEGDNGWFYERLYP